MAILGAACGTTTSEQIAGPDPVRCQITLSGPPESFPASGATATATIRAARECAWTASSEAPWVQVSPSSGEGERQLTITVAANADTRARSTAVVVNDSRLSIAQDAAACHFQLASDRVRIGSEGGRTSVRVSTTEGCVWRASSPEVWVRVLTASGTASQTVELEVSRNDGGERAAILSIGGLPFTVAQDGVASAPGPTPRPPTPPPVVCTYAIDPASATFGSPGGEGSIRVITQAGCTWTATTTVDWIVLVTGLNGSGADTVRYRVPVYPSTLSDRTAVISAAGRTHTVRQQAFHPEVISLEGIVSNLGGSCPSFSFTVADRTFITDSGTDFRGGCTEIRPGVRVYVRGDLLPDGRVRATLVDADD
jgi:hypothetical protein